jgi:outer membrane assembly lipoprotein YfiO
LHTFLRIFKRFGIVGAASLIAACTLLGLSSCGSSADTSKTTASVKPIETRFADAKAEYDKQDWMEAQHIFEEVRIQSPASSIAAEATYMEAMCRFKQELYTGSAVDFRAVRRNFPSSPFAMQSQYMVGESYYELSPKSVLDQTYSFYALTEYQQFLHDYPNAPQNLKDSAQFKITFLRNKLAKKVLMTAELYVKLEEYKSAIVYFKRVLDTYYDTDSAPESSLRLAEVAFQRHKVPDAREALNKFEDKFLETAPLALRQRALELKSKLSTFPTS